MGGVLCLKSHSLDILIILSLPSNKVFFFFFFKKVSAAAYGWCYSCSAQTKGISMSFSSMLCSRASNVFGHATCHEFGLSIVS